ncbi:unnamed protein product [Acanthoscelides obtectus]|uniref:Small ribosomal subunit protein bS6m n=2 Tax=Acanthoscelides obtectus TaxID=200917 RepID=A0A9P0M7M7_ACAOB|nr:unnamed protein product [Acanthoscelides obtectus]CAH2008760.1 unnamed protein product [Acanthoscelides obtectus]CAK1670747.1 Probable 28S ribosomal protein S6, mitochondrial [Acanthoscelides obtectus]CAK1673017.1 Probable 28S ribosomal protein S6, mitochondrial [Acanthoscelides obtectus]
MIAYELMILYRLMPKPELRTALKRTSETIFQKGGIIRKLENLGTRDLPFKISVHGVVYNKADYFLFEFNAPPSSIASLFDEYIRDVDVVRRRLYKKTEPVGFECTLDNEMKPPPYRNDVLNLIEQAKSQQGKPKFEYNTNLDHYPFQK